MNLIFYSISYFYRLSDEEAFKEWHHHWDEPANGAILAIVQAIHHSEVCWNTTGGYNKKPTNEHKPPGQAFLTTLFAVSTAALCWAGATSMQTTGRTGGDMRFKLVLHALDLQYSAVVAIWLREGWRPQQSQLFLHILELFVEILAVDTVFFISLWALTNTALCKRNKKYCFTYNNVRMYAELHSKLEVGIHKWECEWRWEYSTPI